MTVMIGLKRSDYTFIGAGQFHHSHCRLLSNYLASRVNNVGNFVGVDIGIGLE